MPRRDHYVFVCSNRRPDGHPKGSCAASGSEALHSALKTAVGKAGLAGQVRVMTSSCQDVCWMGPTLVVMPENTFLGAMTESEVPALVEAFANKTPVSEHPALKSKVIPPEKFDDPDALVSLRRKG